MRPYDAAMADSREGPAFSNNDMWDYWAESWCYRCRKDHMDRPGTGPECPLILIALEGRIPREWTEGDTQDYVCSEFEERRDGDDGEPPPPAEPDPAQHPLDGLWELGMQDLTVLERAL